MTDPRHLWIKNTGIENAPYGVSGMTVGSDGKTLVLSTPQAQSSFTFGGVQGKRGDVLVFDLSTLNFDTWQIAAPKPATLPADGFSGKSPQTIAATRDKDRYLVSSIADKSKGLSTLQITRDADGKITGAQMKSIDMNQSLGDVRRDRLNIQRAQSAVLVNVAGVEYAIVADDNYNYQDGMWTAMKNGGRKVNVGGKLGIVKDPFGATPEYLGATKPLDGYGIVNLSVSEDGKVLLGQLYGKFGTLDPNRSMPNQSHAWNVKALVEAALAQSPSDRLSNGIVLSAAADQLLKDNAVWALGTYFDPADVKVNVEGKMGDIIEVDLKRQVAHAILGLPAPSDNLNTAQKLLIAPFQTKIDEIMANLCDFILVPGEKENLMGDKTKDTRGMTLVTKNDADKTIISGADPFYKSGTMYLAPNITQADEDTLRSGGAISAGKTQKIILTYSLKKDITIAGLSLERLKAGSAFIDLTVTAKDFATTANTFFGDRPLDNPGYSKFTLTGEVKDKSKDTLDVWRVEQRLKYLGFPAMGYNTTRSYITAADGTKHLSVSGSRNIQDFEVNGTFDQAEKFAVQLFQRSTNGINNGLVATGLANGIVSQNGNIVKWLNAYNAPHWMDLGAQMQNGSLPGWNNTQNGVGAEATNVEHYGTSWTRDLMRAKQYALPTFLSSIPSTGSRFNGAVDANYGISLTSHTTHGGGMNFDLGINYSYLTGVFLTSTALAGPAIDTNLPSKPVDGIWSNQYVLDLNNPVGLNGPRVVLPNTQISPKDFNYQINALYDFLALYSVTRDNGAELNGWDDLHIANGDTVQKEIIRKALFGDGTANGSLIKSVAVGGTGSQNPLVRMGEVLSALGVPPNGGTNYNLKDHFNHFHLNIRPPTNAPVAIVASNNLLAAEATMTDASPIIIAAAPVVAQGEYDAVYSVCNNMVPVDHKDFSLANAVSASTAPISYFMTKFGQQKFDVESWKTTLLNGPKHGELVQHSQYPNSSYMYHPNQGYLGIDQMTFSVEAQGITFKVIYSVHVGNMAPEYGPCPDYGVKELPNPTKDGKGSALNILELPTDGLIDAEALAKLHSMVSFSMGVGLPGSGVSLNISDLPAGALGQTTGTNITLDTNAAGHNWFIDSTPGSNEEFLPTSNPYEWVAKEGSAAYGKMDMLSVLLHEYGHALGIDHSTDGHNYMATTLTAGVRRLPSAEELALMQQLVGEVKAEMASVTTRDSNSPSQLPLLPLGGFGLAFLGRLRGTRY